MPFIQSFCLWSLFCLSLGVHFGSWWLSCYSLSDLPVSCSVSLNLFTLWKTWLFKNSSVAPLYYEGKRAVFMAGIRHYSLLWHDGPCSWSHEILFPRSGTLLSLSLRLQDHHIWLCILCNFKRFSGLFPRWCVLKTFKVIYLSHGTKCLLWEAHNWWGIKLGISVLQNPSSVSVPSSPLLFIFGKCQFLLCMIFQSHLLSQIPKC